MAYLTVGEPEAGGLVLALGLPETPHLMTLNNSLAWTGMSGFFHEAVSFNIILIYVPDGWAPLWTCNQKITL